MRLEDALHLLRWSCTNVDQDEHDRPQPCGRCDVCRGLAALEPFLDASTAFCAVWTADHRNAKDPEAVQRELGRTRHALYTAYQEVK